MRSKAKTSLEAAEVAIRHYFDETEHRVFQERELYRLFENHRTHWKVAAWARPSQFVSLLVSAQILRRLNLKSESHGSKLRYLKENASAFDVALSLAKDSYLCHGTAVFLHALNDQIPRTIYVNREQSAKPQHVGGLTQRGIDLAFAGRQRTSRYVFLFDSERIVLLSGKSTGRLDVTRIDGLAGSSPEVTSIRRTLVDIVVRPGYAGGIAQVLEAYRGARGRVAGADLFDVLKKLNYVYPYHQAIGFVLEKAGYASEDVAPFMQLEMGFDFYLVHGAKEREYDRRWRLFYPKGL